MAEAIAIIGLVASIATLIDLSARVLSRQRDFASDISDVPQSFRSLWTQLPLLTATLKHIQSQAQTRQLPDDVTRALKAVIDSTSEQVSIVQTYLSQVLPRDNASKLERTLKVLKSLAKEDKIQEALEKINKSNNLLSLYQTTRHVDTGDRILEELSKLSVTRLASSKSYGVCLGQAPQVATDAFIGRISELQQLRDWLPPNSQPDGQRIISIAGMGGMGKTQLSLAHVRDCADHYSSVFWVNAKDETSLRQSMAALSVIIFHESANPVATSTDDEKVKVDKVRRWLSDSQNNQWLLIFDNYDDPRLPGIDSFTGYDIRTYFPYRAQGSILITTRSRQLLFAKQLLLKKLEGIEQSLAVLANRSGRAVNGDTSATKLALRLDGLPLALATAGAYLNQSADSFDDYLELYNNSWSELSQHSRGPVDYEERTLYSTWNVSFQQVRGQDPVAAELLKLIAYLDNQDLWYGLFQRELDDAPEWWVEMTKSRVRFNQAISTLHGYSLLEIGEGGYSLHTCEHDWTLEYLNRKIDQEKCRIAVRCVAANVNWESEAEYWVRNRRILPHARRLQHFRITAAVGWAGIESDDLARFAYLYKQNDMNSEAEKMCRRALDGYEKAWGPDHTSTLGTVNNLGILYADQGKHGEAEKMYRRALDGNEKAWGPDHTSTLDTVNNLGLLYKDQGKHGEAEKMYRRALDGYEKAWGPNHLSILRTTNNLRLLNAVQAEHFELAFEIVFGHLSVAIGNLYSDQGKMAEVEEMYQRALDGQEKALGREHTSTLNTVNSLRNLYADQEKMAEAEKMYQRALDG
ncbi:MAG: hypothetical protein Q9194_006681 [Teloschistes cf. exilis]